jgi:hypothetical protein
MEKEWILANTGANGHFGVFNFYPSQTAAVADQARANAWVGWGPYEPMTFDDYLAAERAHYLSRPTKEITGDEWVRMLEVLPPKHWIQQPSYNSFLLSEHTSGPYTSQYVALGCAADGHHERYYTRLVDATDRTTWIQPDYDGSDARPVEED